MERALLWVGLLILLFLSGCVWGQEEERVVEYKDDIITIEEYEVRPLNPEVGQKVRLRFLIQNNGDRTVPWTKVNFFDLPGFTNVEVGCTYAGVMDPFDYGCNFKEMQPLGYATSVGEVSLEMRAPARVGEYTISFLIEYEYSGDRTAHIPLIPEEQREPKFVKFRQSEPPFGPIRLEIEPPVGKERKVNERIIREYWIIGGEEFKLVLRFSHVGRIQGRTSISNATDRMSIETLDLTGDCANQVMYPSEIEIPSSIQEMTCYAEAEPVTTEGIGVISVRFNYTYSYVRTETFTVGPRIV